MDNRINSNELISMFLSQTYNNAWNDYSCSLTQADFPHWDYVVLTASNAKQADAFNEQIKKRKENGLLPIKTEFIVVSDPNGERVGSGGATLNLLKEISLVGSDIDFEKTKILVIHSGGDSKRIPQYSAIGKLFSPIPRALPNGNPSTLFDEFIISMSSVPARMKDGMLLLSGDVLLLFNPLQIDFDGKNAAALSFKESVEIGKNHGVYTADEDMCVSRFLHKLSIEKLYENNAVNDRGLVDIDTGAVFFSHDIISSLISLISTNNNFDDDKCAKFINSSVRLSLYGDFLYPLSSQSTLEEFLSEPTEGEKSELLDDVRKEIWHALNPFRLKLFRLSPSKFIHLGTSKEVMQLLTENISQYKGLGWAADTSSIGNGVSCYNSIISEKSKVGKNCYVESSYIHDNAVLGDNVFLSNAEISDGLIIPSNVVLSCFKQNDGKYVARIFGINDNPKMTLDDNCSFVNCYLSDFINRYYIPYSEVWSEAEYSIWKAKLFPPCNTMKEAIEASLNLYDLINGTGDFEKWFNSERVSLSEGFLNADIKSIINWNNRMSSLIKMETVLSRIKNQISLKEIDVKFELNDLNEFQVEWLNNKADELSLNEKIRLYYYLGKILNNKKGEEFIKTSFNLIRKNIITNYFDNKLIPCEFTSCENEVFVQLPLRVNWGGGWSDTPPYCNELGGTVINASIKLNNEFPVEVKITSIPENKIVFVSNDMGTYGEFDSIIELQKSGDPYDPFALQKAALIACGFIPVTGGNLNEILKKIGGGFILKSEVTNVPKGSGLGTSSILSAACITALYKYFHIEFDTPDIISSVICMEQIMSTGGGWQDQIGGCIEGIKYISSLPGENQIPRIEKLNIPETAFDELNERFALIYTGQRRLARNLLRDVVGNYLGNDTQTLYALNEIQRISALMRFELERGNVDEFAELLNKHWELSKMIDFETTNTLIEQIFSSIEEFICGKMICGAGGGGFLQVILKKGVTKDAVRSKLKDFFSDSVIDVWNCNFII